MRRVALRILQTVLVGVILLAPATAHSQHPKREKQPAARNISNYDGGVLFETDGQVPNGACFRLSGRMTAPEFFDHFKRVDGKDGAEFYRGTEKVTHFPDRLQLSFRITDFPCLSQLQDVGTRAYLTREQMSSLHVEFYWKRGIDLRPIENFTRVNFSVETVPVYATALAAELPRRFQWSYEFSVPSAGVPLTDSLVLIIRTTDNRLAARVGARL